MDEEFEDECVHCGKLEQDCRCREFVDIEDEETWNSYREFMSAADWVEADF